jgi:hypothetical protein
MQAHIDMTGPFMCNNDDKIQIGTMHIAISRYSASGRHDSDLCSQALVLMRKLHDYTVETTTISQAWSCSARFV